MDGASSSHPPVQRGLSWHDRMHEGYVDTVTQYQLDQLSEEYFDGGESRREDIIRSAPTSLDKKRHLRVKHKAKSKPHVSGVDNFKYAVAMKWKKFRYRVYDLSLQFEIWRSSLKEVEGKFGTAVVSYFVFLKWLLFLNLYIGVLFLGFIIVPEIVHHKDYTGNNTCEFAYQSTINDDCRVNKSITTCIVDFLEGSGWLEETILFYGTYSPYYNITLNFTMIGNSALSERYDLPLAYLLTTIAYFLLSLLLMLNYTATAFQEGLANSEDQYYKYCSKLFAGWDYLLTDNNNAHIKHRSIHYELVSDLDEERRALQRLRRTTWQKLKLYLLRIVLNLLVLSILGAAFYVIFYVTDFSVMNSTDPLTQSQFLQLIISFLPSITITLLNGTIPIMFNIIVKFEDYSPQFEIGFTLTRTVFLRLASLIILFISLFPQILCDDDERDQCKVCNEGDLKCWETSIGQEFYKLALTDFAAIVLIVVAWEFPRKLIAKYLHFGIAKALGQMEFEIPKNVLAIVYSQALCWIGAFYCPFLPLITFAKCFVFFYLKKWSLLYNMVPAQRPFRASRSGIFFMVILLATFFLCLLPVGYSIFQIIPSTGCGPFRGQVSMWSELVTTLNLWSSFFSDILQFVGSATFVIPLIVFLSFLLYYYVGIATANKELIDLLKEQLILEGKDKHFLLNRLNELDPEEKEHARKSFLPSTQ